MNIQPTSSYSDTSSFTPQSQANNTLDGRKFTHTAIISLSHKQRGIRLVKALIATLPTLGFALLSNSVRTLWKSGLDGKIEKEFSMILTKDDILSERQKGIHSRTTELFHNTFSQDTVTKFVDNYKLFCEKTAQIGLEKTIKEKPDFIRFVNLEESMKSYSLAEMAIEKDPTSIKFIDKDVTLYEALAYKSVLNDSKNIQYIDKDAGCYQLLAQMAINTDPTNIQYIDKDAACYSVSSAKLAIDKDPSIISSILTGIKDDNANQQIRKDLATYAIEKGTEATQAIDIYNSLPKALQEDIEIAQKVIDKDPSQFYKILEKLEDNDANQKLHDDLINYGLEKFSNYINNQIQILPSNSESAVEFYNKTSVNLVRTINVIPENEDTYDHRIELATLALNLTTDITQIYTSLPESVKEDIEITKLAIGKDPSIIFSILAAIEDNEINLVFRQSYSMRALKAAFNGSECSMEDCKKIAFVTLQEAMKGNRKDKKQAIQRILNTLLSEEIQKEPSIIEIVLPILPSAIIYADVGTKEYITLAEKAITIDPYCIEYIDKNCEGYDQLLEQAADKEPLIHQYLSGKIKISSDPKAILTLLTEIPESESNKKIRLMLTNLALKVAIKANEDTAKDTAIDIYNKLPESLQKDISVVSQVVEIKPETIEYISPDVETYRELAKQAITSNPKVIAIILEKLGDNESHKADSLHLANSALERSLEIAQRDKNIEIAKTIYHSFSDSLKQHDLTKQTLNYLPTISINIFDNNTDEYAHRAERIVKRDPEWIKNIDKKTDLYLKLAEKIIEQSARNIEYVDVDIEKYRELAIKAIQNDPKVISTILRKVEDNDGNKKLRSELSELASKIAGSKGRIYLEE